MLMSVLRKSLIEPLVFLKNGSPRLKYWRELEKTQYLPETRLREIQWQRLREIIHFVWENNEFYRNQLQQAGVTPDNFSSPDDLRRLPILTKAEIRSNTSQMISRGFNRNTLQRSKTGGSTGKALELFFTEQCSEQRNALARRHDRWTGWEPGEPIAACWGNPYIPKTYIEKLKEWLLQPYVYLDTMSVSEASVKAFVKEWHRVKPKLLFGHAHSIYLLAMYMKRLGINSLRPKGIISSSMMLIPSERQIIEDFFAVKVIDRYGCEEVSLIGCECEKHEGMHLNIEHLFIEFIKDDGSYSAPGEPGRIIVTDLLNRAMPLIRYQVEDIGVPTNRKCSCGRGLPLMESVTGRVADFLVRKDKSKVAGISLIENSLTRFSGIDQMQIIQQDYEVLVIRIVTGNSYNAEVERTLVDYFKSVFGKDAVINVSVVDRILPEKSGKYRFSICNVK